MRPQDEPTESAQDPLAEPTPAVSLRPVAGARRERERSAESLRQSEELFRLLIDSVAEYAIFLLDTEGRVATWNLGAERIKGYSAAEIVGRHFSVFYPDDAIAREWPQHELDVAKVAGRFEDEGWRLRKDGTRFWANVIITALFDSEGIHRGYAKITRDLTDRKHREEELRGSMDLLEARVQERTAELTRANAALRAEIAERTAAEERSRRAEAELRVLERQLRDKVAELAVADRRKDDFLATLAHELRNPLAPLRHGLQLLEQAQGDDAVERRARAMMTRQLAQMVRLVDDLLDVSRITRNRLRLRRQPIDVGAALHSALESLQPWIAEKGHRLEVLPSREPAFVYGDPTRLAQVFANLLHNAAKFTPRGGQLRLEVGRQGEEVAVSVRDSGIGIQPGHLGRIFEMFSQPGTPLERTEGGLGIGLGLARALVEMHGGTIDAYSDGTGAGSEFVVRLPACEQPVADHDVSDAPSRAEPTPRLRILVADDNQDSADALGILLGLAGHDVRTAHDGIAALAAAGELRPDVALLDIGMPRANGYEVARRIRREPWGADVVLIAITGWGQREDKRRAVAAGFDHHLTKPVDAVALEALMASGVAARLATP